MHLSIKTLSLFVIGISLLFFTGNSEARSRCDEMRYRYLQAEKQMKTYIGGYNNLHQGYTRMVADQKKLKETIYKLEQQLVVLKKNYPNETNMWKGKENRINHMKRGYNTNQDFIKNHYIAGMKKHRDIIIKNRSIYNQNYKAWLEYGCKN